MYYTLFTNISHVRLSLLAPPVSILHCYNDGQYLFVLDSLSSRELEVPKYVLLSWYPHSIMVVTSTLLDDSVYIKNTPSVGSEILVKGHKV